MKTIYNKLLLLVLLFPLSILAQSTLTGTVMDKVSNQPLPGVNVVVQGTQNGTSTDFDGKFSLKVNKGDVIVFTYIGFKEYSLVYEAQKTISISLEEDSAQLNEVVVIGYGSVKKKDATGSLSVLDAKEFNKGANVTTENLLNGRIAGVTVNTSGAPGSGSEIRIRGGASLNASNDPLIVIDGLPISNTTIAGSTSFLASLNPNTVESITVLKDASATAIYGSRASNGVILITTKKGGKQLSVDYNFQYGSGKLVKTIDVFGADQFRQIITDKFPELVPTLGTANTNWQDEIYQRTDFVDNSLSVKGNLFGAIPSRVTIGNTYQEGLRLTNNFNRSTASVALAPSLFKDHLKIKVNANFTNEKNRFAAGVEGSALSFDPTQPVYDAASQFGGFFEYRNTDLNTLTVDALTPNVARNPVSELLQTRDLGRSNRIFGNFEVDYKLHFLPELRFVANLGYDQSKGVREKQIGNTSAIAFSNQNEILGNNEYAEETLTNKLFDGYFNYNKEFGKLNLDLTGGYSYQKFEKERFDKGNIKDPNLPVNFPETTIDPDIVLIGYFARANFTYNSKYLLTLAFRRDGSSRFAENNRWGNFPAASFAWKINEDFLKENNTISDLKLRVGYGITGQQDTGNERYGYLERYVQGGGVSQYIIGGVAYPVGVPTARTAIKWEETTTYNAGLDFGLLNNRISGSLDAFYKLSEDLLFDAPNADGSNFTNSSFQNIGSFSTRGLELNVNADVVQNEGTGFNWNVNFNATTFQRKIEEVEPFDRIELGGIDGGTGANILVNQSGFTPSSFYVYKQLYDSSGKAIEGAYADLNADGIINTSDRYIYNNTDPDLLLGFATSMNYKNIDFSFNMRASFGNRVYNNVNSNRAVFARMQPSGTLAAANAPVSLLNTNFENTTNTLTSDLYVENASFLRMDNITLGYTFPKWLEGKASVRLFTGVQNAFVLTDYSGLDPEITGGIDKTIYPRQRSLLFGANIKF
ncbi:SusC/RagA family TonB-linked outer membrane protein [Flavobacterium sp.]|jgi:TonB-linked SusC/RagA family outer membrane protein|uniref:SusC/RagA family TonB-linked outer membrane protein n=1 Tax=Flavobacterium sp. TaxID=239 RepID=UPI0037C159DF